MLLYVRPHFRNPVVFKLAVLAGALQLDFPPPDAPYEIMSEAEAAWWKAEEKRRIARVFRPEIEGEIWPIPPPSLPPWGFEDSP